MIKVIEQDLLKFECDAIMHQCNCFCTMGSGVARSIRSLYPEVYDHDCKTRRGDEKKLGKVGAVKIKKPDAIIKYCFNNYSQFNYGYGKRQTNYEAFYRCLEKVRDFSQENGMKSLAAPCKMGCTLAGGDWDICFPMFTSVFGEGDINLTICKYPQPIKQN